jgi:hypothetical protein
MSGPSLSVCAAVMASPFPHPTRVPRQPNALLVSTAVPSTIPSKAGRRPTGLGQAHKGSRVSPTVRERIMAALLGVKGGRGFKSRRPDTLRKPAETGKVPGQRALLNLLARSADDPQVALGEGLWDQFGTRRCFLAGGEVVAEGGAG